MLQELASVIKFFYPYFWRKYKFLDEDDIETECEKIIKNLRKAVWVHRIVSFWQWRRFLESNKNLSSMISSRDHYVSHIYFMVSTTIKDLPNIHESFLTTCSLVTAVAAYAHNKGHKKFLKYCPDILVVLFEENYSKESDRDQIRNHFITCNYSDAYEIVEKKTNGNPFSDVVYELNFVTEIQEKINSTIPVGKDAAAYRYTTEVIKRYKIRKYSFFEKPAIILKGNASTHTVELLQNTEELLQNTDEERQSECYQILLERLFEFANPNQSPQIIKEHIKSESGQRLLMQLSEFTGLKIAQSNSGRQLLQKEEKQEISSQTQSSLPKRRKLVLENEQSSIISKVPEGVSSEAPEDVSSEVPEDVSSEVPEDVSSEIPEGVSSEIPEGVNSEEISSSQSELPFEDARKPKIFENDQSSSKVEDIKAASLMISSSYPEEQSIHNAKKLRISNNEESTSMVQSLEMISKRNSAIQMKKSFQEDLKQPRLSESEQSLSVTEETRDIDSMQISSLESQEQSLQNNTRKLKILDDEQRIPAIGTYNNLDSDDSTSQFETENPTEENYSDTLHDSEATNQNTANQSQQNSKKKKRKSKKKKNSQAYEIKQSSTEVGDNEALDLRISSYSEEKSLQNKETPRDIEESLLVPSKKEVVHALLSLKENLIDTSRNVFDLFNVPAKI